MIHEGKEWHAWDVPMNFKEVSTPSTPPANYLKLYAKDSGGVSNLFVKRDDGSEVNISGGLSGSGANGRVAFWTGASALSSSANLFWDNTNSRLGIGTDSPDFRLTLLGDASSAANTNIAFRDRSSIASGPGISLLKARGTAGSPAATQSGDTLGAIGFGGWTTADQHNAARIEANAGSLWTGSNAEAYLRFFTTPNGSTTRAERLRLDPNGVLVTGGGASQSGLTGPGQMELHPPSGSTGAMVIIQLGFGVGAHGNFQGRSARGTSGSPTATQADDVLARYSGIGYGATAYAASFRAAVDLIAAENWTDSAQGAYLAFKTTVAGGTTSAEHWRITDAGILRGSGGGIVAGGSGAGDDLTLRATTGAGAGGEWIIFQTRNNGSVENMRLGSNSTNPILLFNEAAPKNLAIFSGALVEMHLGTNANFAIAEGSTFAGGTAGSCAFQAYNDAVNANTPLEFRANPFIFTGGPILLPNLVAHPTVPASGLSNIYTKGGSLVFQYNDGGTTRYLYVALTGTGVTWSHDTTGP